MSSGLRQGRSPLSYLGVDPMTPPMMIVEQRDPTDNDYTNYDVGSLWVVTSIPKMWLMVNKNPSAVDKWVQIYPGDGSGTNFFETNSGTASENAGTIKIKGAAGGVLTSMSILDQVTLGLDDDIVINNSLKISTMTEGVVVSNGSGLLSSIGGTDRQFLAIINGTTPTFATLVSEDFSVTIADGTVPGTINFQAVGGGGGGGTDNFETNSGTATQAAGTIEIKGSAGGVLTSMVDPHKVTIELDDDLVIGNSLTVSTFNEGVVVSDASGLLSYQYGTDLQLLVGYTAHAPTFLTPVSEDGSVTIAAGSVPGTINFQAIGGGGGGGFSGLIGENLVTATPLSEKVSVYGDELADDVSNIYTEASGHKINIFHSNLLNIGETTSNGKSGVIKLNSNIYFSAYGSNNLFLGKESGSLSLNIISAINNVGIGSYALRDVDTSLNNTAIGYNSLASLDSGSGGNCCLGFNTGSSLQTGVNNVLIGNAAGKDLAANASNNIIIGDEIGTPGMSNQIIISNSSVTDCYIKGIYGSTSLRSTNGVVLVDDYHKIASSKGTTGQVLTSTSTGVSWQTPSGSSSHYGFYAYQDVDTGWSLAYGTDYLLGTKAVFIDPLNQGSAFYTGDGTSVPASYTAPVTGLYQFNIIVVLNDAYKTGQSSIYKNVGLNLYTPTRNYFQSFLQSYGSGNFSYQFLWNWSVIADLTSGDEVTFGVKYNPSSGTPGYTYSVSGVASGGNDGVGTSLSGYLIG